MAPLMMSDAAGEMRPVADGVLSADGGDIRRRRISGDPAPGQAFDGNFVECRLDGMLFDRLDLRGCDWKDCRLMDAVFRDCDLGEASIMTNAFRDCRFQGCRFRNTSVNDATFDGCSFERCDFTSVVIKASRFSLCLFAACLTSNRMIESSLLLRTTWSDMSVEEQTVLGNFGLRRTDLHRCSLYRKGDPPDGEERQAGRLDLLTIAELSPVERFRKAYFETAAVDGDPDALEAALDLRNWGHEGSVHASFGHQLLIFSQFLSEVFDADEAPIYCLLILHTQNFRLLEWLADHPELPQLYIVAAGVHLSLTRRVEDFARRLDALVGRFGSVGTVRVAAEGPVDPAYFQRWFDYHGIGGLTVVSVEPRNSPVDLVASFADHRDLVALIALLLACRTKIELSRIGDESPSASGTLGGASLMTVSSGFSPANASEYELVFRTLLPRSFLLELNLTFSVAVFKDARRVLVDLLTRSGSSDGRTRSPAPRGRLPSPRSRRE